MFLPAGLGTESSRDILSCFEEVVLKIWCNFFLSLQDIMKNVIIKVLALLLSVWYSMSIIGFDVHTCNGSGRSFVVTFLEGLTCEEIHPEHSCDKAVCCADKSASCCCGHRHTGDTFKAPSCCSNDYQVLALTGTVSHNDHGHYDECSCGLCPCVGFPVCERPPLSQKNNQTEYLPYPGSGVDSACERQAALRVWRI